MNVQVKSSESFITSVKQRRSTRCGDCPALVDASKGLVMSTQGHSFLTRKKPLQIRQVIETTGLSRSAIYRQIQSQSFPRPLRIAPKSVAWYEDEVRDWMKHPAPDSEGTA